MLRHTKPFISIALCLIALQSSASSYPRGCEVTGFQFNNKDLILNEKNEQAFYLLQNRSDQKIELEHFETNPDAFMSPKLETKFDPNQWAAFASDIGEFHFRCYAQKNDERVWLDCSEVLDVCQYPRVKFALSNMGNYWVSTNKPQAQVIKDSVNKGILLRW